MLHCTMLCHVIPYPHPTSGSTSQVDWVWKIISGTTAKSWIMCVRSHVNRRWWSRATPWVVASHWSWVPWQIVWLSPYNLQVGGISRCKRGRCLVQEMWYIISETWSQPECCNRPILGSIKGIKVNECDAESRIQFALDSMFQITKPFPLLDNSLLTSARFLRVVLEQSQKFQLWLRVNQAWPLSIERILRHTLFVPMKKAVAVALQGCFWACNGQWQPCSGYDIVEGNPSPTEFAGVLGDPGSRASLIFQLQLAYADPPETTADGCFQQPANVTIQVGACDYEASFSAVEDSSSCTATYWEA